jgi:cytochrome P450
MLNEMARLTARVIGRSIFGDSTSDDEAAQVVQGFTEYQRHVEQLDLADSLGLPFLRYFRNPLRTRKTLKAGEQVHKVIDEIIERCSKNPGDDKFNLISMFLTGNTGPLGKDHACPLDSTASRNEAIVMFMAGHETTANSLAWAWYLLDKYPEAMKKVQQEVDDVLEGCLPTLDDIDNLPYTRAVFEESMRLYPPVPLLSRQARHADQVEGVSIEKDAIILVVPWLLHRHELFWDEPEAFKPERFLPGATRPDKFTYIPFSVGHRVCLGKRFGLVEGITCLAMVAQSFTTRLLESHSVEIECRLTLRPKDGLPMKLVGRP